MRNNQKQQKLFSLMSNLQTYYFKLYFQKNGPIISGLNKLNQLKIHANFGNI